MAGKDGSKTELVPGQLILPGGVVVKRTGTIYLTTHSVSIGGGEVVRLHP